jgi:Acyl-CoA thioesterase C-terminal domain/Acyl-CoA thioesterase N-terminal domain
MEAFYEPSGERFAPTESTRGPWDPNAQHAGPPAALLGRALELCDSPDGPAQIGRVTFEILGPVPLEPLAVAAEVVRPGRSVELLAASLAGPEGEVMRAQAWRLRTHDTALEPAEDEPPPGPGTAEPRPFFPTGQEVGYHTAMDYRFVRGSFREAGPATVWMRMLGPLVEGEEPTPLERLMVAADAGNGVSAAFDWRRFLFINTELSVHLTRPPDGDWVCLDAITHVDGIGLADTALFDWRGRIGRVDQSLLVRERPIGED